MSKINIFLTNLQYNIYRDSSIFLQITHERRGVLTEIAFSFSLTYTMYYQTFLSLFLKKEKIWRKKINGNWVTLRPYETKVVNVTLSPPPHLLPANDPSGILSTVALKSFENKWRGHSAPTIFNCHKFYFFFNMAKLKSDPDDTIIGFNLK